MKYFNNITTLDELKKKYREYCLTMHPDKGGNKAAFQEMSAEYEQAAKGMNGTKQHAQEEAKRQEAEARRREKEEEEAKARAWQEEERKRREEEERREAERIAKAQEETRAAVRAWAHILERMPETISGKIRGSYFTDNKSRAAYVAIVKRNVKAVINHYFPGLKVSVTISGAIWKEDFSISWVDGPSVEELRKTCKELSFFIPSHYESDPYADYGSYCNNEGTAPWREAFGGALGDATKLDYNRTLSEEGKAEAEQAAAAIFANWTKDTDHGRGTFAASLDEWVKLAERLGMKRDERGCTDLYGFGMSWGRYANNEREEGGHSVGDFYFSSVRRLLREKFTVTAQPKEKAPEFVPTYGKTYKAIKKVMGQNVFFINQKDSRKNADNELTIFEAAERLAKGEGVNLGKRSTWDDEPVIYGTEKGGYKTQQKRAAKYEEVGIILEGVSYNTYGIITALGIKPGTLEALRREAQDIERQRKEWEEAQTNKAQGARDKEQEPTATPAQAEEAPTMTEAPAEGLQLVEIAGGVAVVGNDWKATYYNKKAIKAHGCKWNKEAKRWEATDPADVVRVRAWFALRDGFEDIPQKTDEEIRQEAAEDIRREEEATSTPSEPTAKDEQPAADIAPLLSALADLLMSFADIIQEAKKWEGVTIPADTLNRWREQTEQGATNTAAKFAEVCACLGSMTPDNRKEFDALGVIFWTLSEQIRNGYDADTINRATDYARVQLFDLIDRTQTAAQAAAIRRATYPESMGEAA